MTYSYLTGASGRQTEAPLLGYPSGIIYEPQGVQWLSGTVVHQSSTVMSTTILADCFSGTYILGHHIFRAGHSPRAG